MVDPVVAGRVRRNDILAAAEREFGSLGWSGGRIERIAATAGVNKQLLFHYFESKAGLYTAATRSLLARFEPASAAAAGPLEEMRLVTRTLETAARAIPGVLLRPRQHEADDLPSTAADTVAAWRERLRDRLAAAVTEGQRRGHFRDDLDPDAVAAIALALALGTGAAATPVDIAAWLVDACAWR